MLICPECQFENPNGNNFCQKCGTSLTHKVCPQCSTDVSVDLLQCHHCGAECGTVWWAIVGLEGTGDWGLVSQRGLGGFPHERLANPKGGTGKEESTEEQEIVGVGDNVPQEPVFDAQEITPDNAPTLPPKLSVGSYLGKEQRYQFLASPLVENGEVSTRVLDRQPYQISPIEAILANQRQGVMASVNEISGIPKIAEAYIALQSPHHPEIPQIHDAWEDDEMQVVLIEDRSHWQYLLDAWKQETTSSLQILHWCYQMTQLWTLLEPLNCHYSLLDISNLRLDEDQTLGLQRLYSQPIETELPDTTATFEEISAEAFILRPLGRVWQQLFRSSQRTQFGSLIQVLEDLEQGNIPTIAQLRSRLQDVATELEVGSSPIFAESVLPTASPTFLQIDDSEDTLARGDDLPTVVLSMQLSNLEDAGSTDVGRQRQHNEDCFGIVTKIEKVDLPKNRILQAQGLYILCDGMGGHAGGEVASQLAVQTLRQYFQENWDSNQFPSENKIREAVYLANRVIYEKNQQDARSGVGRMGTTLVMLLIQGNQAAVAHVGDSRLYRLTRKRGLEQLTLDHEVGQREISRGVEASIAYARPDAYQLTQALGPRDDSAINPDVEFFTINEDSLFVLVSDGLSDNDLLETHWQNHLLPLLSFTNNLEQGVTTLIDLANQYNGHDNITAILIRAKVRPNTGSRE
ncbi:serine/threonine protein phosphatase [Nostoc sp. CENA543]|uniref:serine/threonine phosphatase n=1 Tax=Nostoc sp. CENA543 TaxID=1869241 RepID=UPI000CA2EE7C|nr:serine/threonine phosphatase [Nostoc sp. CENA543]AUT02347.1 serine/threonine protein phosphatase [Nostoc sp. CENA543]